MHNISIKLIKKQLTPFATGPLHTCWVVPAVALQLKPKRVYIHIYIDISDLLRNTCAWLGTLPPNNCF